MAFRDRYHLEPLLVRAYLRAGVVSDEYLPLDGVLLYQAHRASFGFQDFTLPGEYTNQSISTLPLGISNPGRRQWYYQCSWAQWPNHVVQTQDHWNKRFDTSYASLIDFQGKRGKIIIEQGPTKAYHSAFFYRSALWIDWYCVGDKQEIEVLLCCVTHVGKKSSQGWGRVGRWEIVSISDDYSIWYGSSLMRGIPLEEAPSIPKRGVYGIRPSYWNKSNQMMLALP